MASPYSDDGRLKESHEHGLQFESDVLSDFTGWWEKPREQINVYEKPDEALVTFDYSTVAYDVVYKAGTGNDIFVAQVTKRVKVKPRVK
jgi:hypothetical protein